MRAPSNSAVEQIAGSHSLAAAEPSEFLRGVKLCADKQIAHLTKKRFTGDAPEKQWDPIEEISALLPGLTLFLNHGRPELLHANVSAAIERLAARVTPKGEL